MAIGKLTCKIKLNPFIKTLYPIWCIQHILGIRDYYMPKWAFKLELEK